MASASSSSSRLKKASTADPSYQQHDDDYVYKQQDGVNIEVLQYDPDTGMPEKKTKKCCSQSAKRRFWMIMLILYQFEMVVSAIMAFADMFARFKFEMLPNPTWFWIGTGLFMVTTSVPLFFYLTVMRITLYVKTIRETGLKAKENRVQWHLRMLLLSLCHSIAINWLFVAWLTIFGIVTTKNTADIAREYIENFLQVARDNVSVTVFVFMTTLSSVVDSIIAWMLCGKTENLVGHAARRLQMFERQYEEAQYSLQAQERSSYVVESTRTQTNTLAPITVAAEDIILTRSTAAVPIQTNATYKSVAKEPDGVSTSNAAARTRVNQIVGDGFRETLDTQKVAYLASKKPEISEDLLSSLTEENDDDDDDDDGSNRNSRKPIAKAQSQSKLGAFIGQITRGAKRSSKRSSKRASASEMLSSLSESNAGRRKSKMMHEE